MARANIIERLRANAKALVQYGFASDGRDEPIYAALLREAADAIERGNDEPVSMILWCPACAERHIDNGEFATKRHHTHACQVCGFCWRPAVVPTVGVHFLPGFKDLFPPEAIKTTVTIVTKESPPIVIREEDR